MNIFDFINEPKKQEKFKQEQLSIDRLYPEIQKDKDIEKESTTKLIIIELF